MSADTPRPAGRGAPLRLTRDAVDRIAASVELGAFVSAAVQAEGFSRRAYQRWLRVGAAALRREARARPLRPAEEVYAYFLVEVRKAAGRCQADGTMRLRELGENDADALDRFLAKRFPAAWGDAKLKRLPADAAIPADTARVVIEIPPKEPPAPTPTESHHADGDGI